MSADLHIEPLIPAVREMAVGILARAFRDNPLNCAVIGGGPEHRLRSVVHGMRGAIRSAMGRSTILLGLRRESPAGVLVAVPPGRFPGPQSGLFEQLRSLLGQGVRVSTRWGEVSRAFMEVHPVEPHWYLSLLGVDPPHQGHGVGLGLLEYWLAAVEGDQLPSYLETDREENVAFYQRVGFEVQLELTVLETHVWCMHRVASTSLPRSGASDLLDTS